MSTSPTLHGIEQSRYDRLIRQELDGMIGAWWYVYRHTPGIPPTKRYARERLMALLAMRGRVRRMARFIAKWEAQ